VTAGGFVLERIMLALFVVGVVLALFVGILVLLDVWRSRPRPPQHLSDSAGSAQFAQQQEEARGRR
jgi:tellurite resistance protein TehA-like permease